MGGRKGSNEMVPFLGSWMDKRISFQTRNSCIIISVVSFNHRALYSNRDSLFCTVIQSVMPRNNCFLGAWFRGHKKSVQLRVVKDCYALAWLFVLFSVARYTWPGKKAIPRFGESCSCCCLPLLSQLGGSILATWEQPYRHSLYMNVDDKGRAEVWSDMKCERQSLSFPVIADDTDSADSTAPPLSPRALHMTVSKASERSKHIQSPK